MPIPAEFENLFQWWSSVVTDQTVMNAKFEVFWEFWGNLTAGQKTAIKNLAANSIDTSIADLTAIKAHINGV